ncbi:MAG: recN, partial [Acidimicrobiales bacterium]|nr:recN [Acidimicrobiales bacterium]
MTAAHPAPRGRLVELAVTDLGVIDRIQLLIGPGMTALTGETGAGKTMLVGAIELLVGGRADGSLVRPGATEAVIEGRFELDGEEVVLTRVVAGEGRSRAYVNGRMATVGALAEQGAALVDLHGQHAHQSLLAAAVQRDALDRFGSIDLEPLRAARAELRQIDGQLAALGGDPGARAREIDLLRFQLQELEAAAISDPDEDQALDAEEDRLADAVAHRAAALAAAEAVSGEGGALDAVAATIGGLDGRTPFADAVVRLRSVSAELGDLSAEIRATGEGIDEDPARLEVLRGRRQLLAELRRKYGTAAVDPSAADTRAGTLADVMAYHREVGDRLAELEQH